MIIRTRTMVNKKDFIKLLSYHIWHSCIDTMEGITRKEAIKILRDAVWWNGKCGWPGAHSDITDVIGEFEAYDKYLECEAKATAFVDKNFPNFK